MSELVGSTLGAYKILSQIGSGGYATVYRAYHPATEREVAVKVLQGIAIGAVSLARFEREARVIASLQHIHILPIYDYGEQDGITYLVMRYVPTGTLREYMREIDRLEIDEGLRLFYQVADAVEYAHQHEVLHRDIKPANVLLDDSRNALLADFGLARSKDSRGTLTEDGIIGTPLYIAPEQAEGGDVDARSDIYALGILLYEILTGDVPFRADTAIAIILKHLNAEVPPPRSRRADISSDLEAVILQALAKSPRERFPSARAMIDALQRATGEATESRSVQSFKLPGQDMLLMNVPALPVNMVQRPAELDTLSGLVLGDTGRRHINMTALHGMGGIGKSVLAAALCHQADIQEAFPNGIIWIKIGRENNTLTTQLREFGRALGDKPDAYDSLEMGSTRLKALLQDRAVLIVLDDVWAAGQVEPFQMDAPRTHILFTTRDGNIPLSLGAAEMRVGVLAPAQAIEMLREWAGHNDPHLQAIAERLGYLPLALKLAGARLREGLTGEDWLATFQHVAQMTLGRRATDPQENLAVCFDLSIHQLGEEDRALYYTLAIFPEDDPIPVEVIARLWMQHDPGLTRFDCDELVTELVRMALLDREAEQKAVLLHDLLYDYARDQLGAQTADTHAALLDAYNPQGVPWSHIPDDGYLYEHLAYHLSEAGRNDVLSGLLFNFEWLLARLTYTNPLGLIRDYDYHPSSNPAQSLVQGLLKLAAHILAQDPTQLGPQLIGGLMGLQAPEIQDLLRQAREGMQGIWLRPLAASFATPGGALMRTIVGHRQAISAVAFTPDGERIISASHDWTIKIWDFERGTELNTLYGHADRVSAIVVTPDGGSAISGSHDMTIRIWDLGSGDDVATLKGHIGYITGLAISPDGQYLISAALDNTLKVWDIWRREVVRTLTGHTGQVTAVDITADGQYIVSGSTDQTLRVWNLHTGECLHTIRAHESGLVAVAVSHDGRYAISGAYAGFYGAEAALKVWDLTSGELAYAPKGHSKPVYSLTMTPDGQHFISGSEDKTIRMWRLEDGAHVLTLHGNSAAVSALAVSPDGRWLVSGTGVSVLGIYVSASDIALRTWDLKAAHSAPEPRGHTDTVSRVVITPDGRYAVSASEDYSLKVWDLSNGASLHTLRGHNGAILHIVALPDSQHVVSASVDMTLKVWDILSGECVHTLSGHHDRVESIAITPDGALAISSAGMVHSSLDTTLRIWNMTTGTERMALYGGQERILTTTVLPVGDLAVSAVIPQSGEMDSFDTTLQVWDVETGAIQRTLAGHKRPVYVLKALPDGRLISAGQDNLLKLWDVYGGRELTTLRGHTEQVAGVAVTPDGKRAVSVGADRVLRVWTLDTGLEAFRLKGHTETIIDVALTPDGRYAATVSFDHSLKVWDLNTRQLVANFIADGALHTLAITPDGHTLVAGGQSGQVHILRLEH